MKRKLNKTRLIIFLLCVIGVLLLTIVAIVAVKMMPVDRKAGEEAYTVEVGKGTYEVYEDLEDKGYIKSAFLMKLYSKLKGNIEIDAGDFTISKSYSIPKMYETLKVRNSVSADEIEFTLLEGENIKALAKKISEVSDITEEDFLKEINDKEFIKSLIAKYSFLTEEVLNENIYYSLEGYLFPDTYRVLKSSTPHEIVEKMLEELGKKLKEYEEDIKESEFTIHEILTLASILELEGAGIDDKASISGVFVNRIRNGWALGADATTYYAVGIPLHERELTYNELDDCSNKYNTRCDSNIGLPVGPIANPGIASIEASINPEDNNYYYYASDKYLNIYFSKTYNEHLSTVARLKREGIWYEY